MPPNLNPAYLRGHARSLAARGRSDRTIQSYREAAEQLADHHGGADLASLTRAHIENYLAWVIDTHSLSTAANRYRSLQQLYKWMVAEEIIEVSPMLGMDPPAVPDKPVPVLDLTQIRALLKACDGKRFEDRRDAAIFRLFLEPGGPRLSELTALTVDDVDLDQDLVFILGKGRKPRAMPFGHKTGQALERYLRLRGAHPAARLPALWLGGRGVPLTPSGVTQVLRRRAKTAGLGHLHPHMLRHTAAHNWLSQGGGETDAMRLFGWSSRSMLSRYGASAADGRAREAARRLGLSDRY